MATPERPLPPAVAEALAARSGGHPLLLRELARAVARGEDPDELPSTVEELAASQIDRLPPAQRSLLRRAAVLGDEFDEDLLLRMVGDVAPQRSLPELLAGLQGLIVAEDHQLRFRHAILREVAYAGLPYQRRRELHARAAEVLEATTSLADRRPEVLALHYFVAGRYDRAMEYGWRAGERAMERHAPAAAADAYRRAAQAARLSSSVSPSERSFYLEALGDAQFLAGRSTEAAAAYLEALRGVHEQPLRDAHLALKLTRVEQRRGHYTNALRRASLGLRALGDATGPEAGAARARLQPATRSAGSARVATRMPVDGRSEPSPKLRRLISWTRRPRRTWCWTPWRCGPADPRASSTRRQRCTSSSSSGPQRAGPRTEQLGLTAIG